VTTLSIDTETGLITPGIATPPLACVSHCQGSDAGLLDATQGLEAISDWLHSPNTTFVTANGVYDFGVGVAARPALLKPVFDAYEMGRIVCVQNRQKLEDIASGQFRYIVDDEGEVVKNEYSLGALAQRHLGVKLEKGKRWSIEYKDLADLPPEQWYRRTIELAESEGLVIRFRYARLIGVPLAEWPEEARTYAVDDAVTTLKVYEAQPRVVPLEHEITREHWAFNLMRIWGIRTDPGRVATLRAKLEAEAAELRQRLANTGFVREGINAATGKPWPKALRGRRDMTAIKQRVVAAFEGRDLPLTDSGAKLAKERELTPEERIDYASTGKEAKELSGDPDLATLGEYEGVCKVLSSFVPVLEQGTRAPITADWNCIVETLRSSCRRPALQTPPRKGGVRECFVARTGVPLALLGLAPEGTTDMVYLSSDYDTAELRSWAEKCLELGLQSRMAEAFARDEDPHLIFAAHLRRRSYEETVRLYQEGDDQVTDDRQLSKIPNFGFPGGMGDATLVGYARNQGVKLCEAARVREQCRGQGCGELPGGQPNLADPGCRTVAAELGQVWRSLWTESEGYFRHINEVLRGKDQALFVDDVTGHRRVAGYTNAANGYFQTRTARGAKYAFWLVVRECYVVPESPLYGSRPVLFFHDQIVLETPIARGHAAAMRLRELMLLGMGRFLKHIPVKTEPVLMTAWYKKAKPVWRDGMLQVWQPA
jgi:hypothetical protein